MEVRALFGWKMDEEEEEQRYVLRMRKLAALSIMFMFGSSGVDSLRHLSPRPSYFCRFFRSLFDHLSFYPTFTCNPYEKMEGNEEESKPRGDSFEK